MVFGELGGGVEVGVWVVEVEEGFANYDKRGISEHFSFGTMRGGRRTPGSRVCDLHTKNQSFISSVAKQ